MNFDDFALQSNFFPDFPVRQGKIQAATQGGSFDMLIGCHACPAWRNAA
jgi:hypothetical protein